jgi:hypothetical protein
MWLKLMRIGLIVVLVALLLGNLAVCKKITNDPQGCRGAKPDDCNGKCVNFQIDNHNCGTCGTICGSGDVCHKGKCISANKGIKANCTDGVKNGDETGVDCGGSCQPCPQQVSLLKKPIINKGGITASTPPAVLTNLSTTNLSASKPQPLGPILHGGIGGIAALGYSCEGLYCTCEGDEDCNDMFLHAGCGDIAQCKEGGSCWCFKKL